ncbi:proteoglycan 4-like [Gigantopelta aegis]|uniref:proteoglycan 4-like n=1 Tax=Gigantopelta aegis TaxID=1735272 RepID=UPI001B88B0D5|nr:proteoglycan 4-like [Gigantopelta aegis]
MATVNLIQSKGNSHLSWSNAVQTKHGMSSCSEFTQNAWRHDLCANCQRSRSEHGPSTRGRKTGSSMSSPVPTKRRSVILKPSQSNGLHVQNCGKLVLDSGDIETPNSSKSSVCKIQNGHESGKQLSLSKGDGLSVSKSLDKKKNRKECKIGKVIFKESEPEIIGYDGGVDNLLDDEPEDAVDSVSVGDELSLTEEEKQFALLALENTVWNSDVANLKSANSTKALSRKTSCKEFEDLDLNSLLRSDRFHNLSDCDGTIRIYGTFPMRKKPLSKMSLDDVFSSDIELQRIADNIGDRADSESSGSEHYKNPCVEKLKSVSPSMTSSSPSSSLSSDSDKMTTPAESDSVVAYKIVNIIRKDNTESYTVDDITDCLYEASMSGSVTESSVTEGNSGKDASATDEKTSSNPMIDWEKKFDSNASFSDSESTIAGLEVVELLNDVLASYGGMEIKYSDFLTDSTASDNRQNESSTDSPVVAKKETGKLPKKSTDFEARMATVAANLDLTKTRSKRPAPRPPSPPPPEPHISPKRPTSPTKRSTSPTKRLTNPAAPISEPNFKMVTMGKSIVTMPNVDQPLSDKSSSEPILGLQDSDSMENVRGKSADAAKSRRGFTSFFRNILRRGRESPEVAMEINPDITFLKAEQPRTEDSVVSAESKDNSAAGSPGEKRSSKFSPQAKFRVLPPSSVPPVSATNSAEAPTDAESDSKVTKNKPADVSKSPSLMTQNKGCSSPKQTPKHEGTKTSSPQLKRSSVCQTKEEGQSSRPQLPAKPPPIGDDGTLRHRSAKPSSADDGSTAVVRRRAKSPKRTAPPAPPVRTSVPNRITESRNRDFARELELRLSRSTEGAASIKDSAKVSGHPSSPTSPVPELDESVPSSPTEKESAKSFSHAESPKISKKVTIAKEQKNVAAKEKNVKDKPKSPTSKEKPEESKAMESEPLREKIELPTVLPQSRKSFLGKLANKKSRAPAPPPPSVKRAKSITETTLPRRSKKINVADISGPVMVTDMTNTRILTNRRNTLSLGDDTAFASGQPSSATDKYMDDLPPISPIGSFDNLYESILPKMGGPHQINPITGEIISKGPICPNIPAEGYLEPVPPNSNTSELTGESMMTSSMMSSSIVSIGSLGSGIPAAMTTSTMSMVSVGAPSTIEEEDAVSEVFDEPDENRLQVLASQPIYEEIPNGYTINQKPSHNKSNTEEPPSSVSLPSQTNLGLPNVTIRSQSKETISSESDSQSNSSTLSRPKPAPRRKPKRSEKCLSEQYVSMNRPNPAVMLGEERLREVYSKLTTMNLQTLQDVYSQVEKILAQEKLVVSSTQQIKWQDFDLFGQPVHSSERCIVYNAKFRAHNSPCQLMLLHSRSATETSSLTHPSLLKPVVVFADTIPFSFLTEEFIKTSQLVQNSIYDTSLAKCFCAVGNFDIIENLDSHLTLLRETLTHNLDAYMHVILSVVLQLLSSMSHCLDQGFTVSERDFRDIYLVSRSDLRGKVITFLPHQRSRDVPQGESMCNFLDRLLNDASEMYSVDDDDDIEDENFSANIQTVEMIKTLRAMLEPRKIECLAQVRSVVEYILWGPNKDPTVEEVTRSSLEQDMSSWLEAERAMAVSQFAKNSNGFASGLSLDEYYRLKFLLKSSATSLAESARKLVS